MSVYKFPCGPFTFDLQTGVSILFTMFPQPLETTVYYTPPEKTKTLARAKPVSPQPSPPPARAKRVAKNVAKNVEVQAVEELATRKRKPAPAKPKPAVSSL